MRFRIPVVVLAAVATLGSASGRPVSAQERGSYVDLVTLFGEWRAFQQPRITNGVADYSKPAMQRQAAELPRFVARLEALTPDRWPVPEQIDWQIVRAEMNGLDFDHRVLRPWSRNPCFYRIFWDAQSDTPAHEGHGQAAALELWTYTFPIPADRLGAFRTWLQGVPATLEQARSNLVEGATDLWMFGVRLKRTESRTLADLIKTLQQHHPALVPDAERARKSVDDFAAWLEAKAPSMKGPSGVGKADYDWYMRKVHLSPFTWEDDRALHERELARAGAQLALQRNLNRGLPESAPIATAEEFKRRFASDVTEYMRFLADNEILTIKDYMDGSLREREGGFQAPGDRDFFAQVDFRDPIVMRCHGSHWFDLARMAREPHSSPIRRGALLYNIWDSRAEGFATANEEMMMNAGLLEKRPRSKELISILVANRAARGLAGLKQHSRELDANQARRFAHDWTPNGWLKEDGETNWMEQLLYLEQPGYGSSYLTGKAQIERLLMERQRALGDRFSLKGFMDRFGASGLIPVSLIRWEMTGDGEEIKRLTR